MFKRLLPAALIAAVLALVTVGGVVLATGRDGGEDKEELVDRVAADLGLEPQAVRDALSQAEREALQEKQEEFLDNLVERGVITQEEADSASAWLDARPAAADKLLKDGRTLPIIIKAGIPHLLPGIEGHLDLDGIDEDLINRVAGILGVNPEALREAFQNAVDALRSEKRTDALNDVVDALVDEGVLTQAEGDEVKAWVAEMPDWLKGSDLFGRLLGPGGPSLFSIPGDAPLILPFNLPEGLSAPGGMAPFRFHFDSPEGRFDFRSDPDALPEGLAPLLDEFHRRFEFDLQEMPPQFKDPASPAPEPGATPLSDAAITLQDA